MKALHIAVGVLIDAQGRVLIAQRRAGTAGAGKWEFPGGKREAGESIDQALARELHEELGVRIDACRPMLCFLHSYEEQQVLLDIWHIPSWQGLAHGREGQRLVWCEPRHLLDYDLLSANKPIVDAIRLGSNYAITPELDVSTPAFLAAAKAVAANGVNLMRLRAWHLSDVAYEALALELLNVLHSSGVDLLLDRTPKIQTRVGAAGLHLPAHYLATLDSRPVPSSSWFGVSCHNREELLQAKALGADFATLSPVNTTASHPERVALGWQGFAQASEGIAMPIFALGGLAQSDLADAWANGAQGIAGISAFWPGCLTSLN